MALPSDRVSHLDTDQRSALRRSHSLTQFVGSPRALVATLGVVAIWLLVGAGTGFPRWWELAATIGLPVLTLLALIVLQHTQNHDDRALQVKLDEILRALEPADERLVGVEDADTAGLDDLHAEYRRRRPPANTRR